MIKIQRTCSNPSCQHKNEILEDENIISPSSINLTNRGLQQIIDEWSNRRKTIKKHCLSDSCPTHYQNGKIIQNEDELPDIEHEERSTVFAVPLILYIKLRDLRTPRLDIDMVESFH